MPNSEQNQRDHLTVKNERRNDNERYHHWNGYRSNAGKQGHLQKATAKRRKARKAAKKQR